MNIKIFYINSIFIFSIFFIIFLFNNSFAWGDPQIVGKINSAFLNIEKWIIQISTPAAAVAVGSGIFMRKI